MSLEEILTKVRAMSDKVDTLSTEVEDLKEKEAEKHRTRSPSPARSRSPRRKRTPERDTSPKRRRRSSPTPRRGLELPLSWADRDPNELADYNDIPRFSDEDGINSVDPSQLVEVSEGTHKLLKVSCTRSVSNEARKRMRSYYKLPKVDATRTPKVDHVVKSLATQTAKTSDRELAWIQSFVLDALAPLTAVLESKEPTVEDVKEASSTATALIGNANAQISHLRREKLAASINKDLLPLVKDDAEFTESAPNLFGPEFSKRAKDYLDQVKALKSASLPSHYSNQQGYHQGYRRPGSKGSVSQTGYLSERGTAKGKGGAPYNKFKAPTRGK